MNAVIESKSAQIQPVRAATELGAFANETAFEGAQRMAKMLASSKLIPATFQNDIPNCVIALEMAARLGSSPLSVMQSLYVVHGNPTWSAQYVIAAVNSSGKFQPLRFRVEGDGDDRSCTAWTRDNTGEVLEGPAVSISMAKAEGWHGKKGSKWQTMPELMLRYRAATFFGRLYAPELMMGMKTTEEAHDLNTIDADGNVVDEAGTTAALNDALKAGSTGKPAETSPEPDQEKAPAVTLAQVTDAINKAQDMDALDAALDLSNSLKNPTHRQLAQQEYDNKAGQLGDA